MIGESPTRPGIFHDNPLVVVTPDISPLVFTARQLMRSEEHTSELQSRRDLVCRLLHEKKNRKSISFGARYVFKTDSKNNRFIFSPTGATSNYISKTTDGQRSESWRYLATCSKNLMESF